MMSVTAKVIAHRFLRVGMSLRILETLTQFETETAVSTCTGLTFSSGKES
jgi:hypothetical protein